MAYGTDANDRWKGSREGDIYYGRAGGDVILGREGRDELYGEDGDDAIDGGEGGDTLVGGLGADRLTGGAGDDSIEAGDGSDTVDGGDGQDLISIRGLPGDRLSIDGGESNDSVYANGGNYVALRGGEGQDRIGLSDAVLDRFDVRNGFEVLLYASDIRGTAGDNIIDFSHMVAFGRASVFAGAGNDYLGGTTLNDYLLGEAGDDRLIGGDGDDRLVGGTGRDRMDGGAGADEYVVDHKRDAVIETGTNPAERDTVEAWIDYQLGANVEDLKLYGDARRGTGNALGNRITGTDAANTLRGLDGDDVLDGRGGADVMYGGAGNDTFYVDQWREGGIELEGEGYDQVFATSDCILFNNVEKLTLVELAGGGGPRWGEGNDIDNIIVGNSADNVLRGWRGDDELVGGDGDDELDGYSGNDVLIGGAGIDRLEGSYGADTYVIDRPEDTIYESGTDVDTVVYYATYDGSPFTYTIPTYVENLEIRAGSAAGLSGLYTLNGNASDNLIHGNFYANHIRGEGGNDTLVGGYYGDILDGGSGDDVLDPSWGEDKVTLGSGADKVLYLSGAGMNGDVVYDFASEDVIDLSYIDADASTARDDAFRFIGTDAFSGARDELRVASIGNGVYHCQVDQNGDKVADVTLKLRSAKPITAADFLL